MACLGLRGPYADVNPNAPFNRDRGATLKVEDKGVGGGGGG